MNKLDWLEKVNSKDPNLFRSDFPGLINPAQLPKPTMDRLYENEIWSKGGSSWITENQLEQNQSTW